MNFLSLFKIFSRTNVSSFELINILSLIVVMLKAEFSLYKAIIVAGSFSDGRFHECVDRAIKKAILGNSSSLETAIEEENEKSPMELKQVYLTLQEFIIANNEPNRHIRINLLDQSFNSALTAFKNSLRESLSNLKIPVTTIFAIGIVLPIIITSMLPLWSLSSPGGWFAEFSLNNEVPQGETNSFIPIDWGILLIFIFPPISMLSAYFLLSNNVDISLYRNPDFTRNILIALVIYSFFNFSVFIFIPQHKILLIIFSSCILTISILSLWKRQSDVNRNIKNVWKGSNNLNLISHRLILGDHYIRAIADIQIKSQETNRFLFNILTPVRKNNHQNIKKNLKIERLISESSDNDPRLTAQMLRNLSVHLNELASIKFESRMELRPIKQSIIVATIFLSPFVLGLLSGFSYLGSLHWDQNISYEIFEYIFLVFVVEMVIVGQWFIEYIELESDRKIGILYTPVIAIAISICVFIASGFLSNAMFF